MKKQYIPLNDYDTEDDDDSFAGSAEDWGFGPEEYEETMGLNEDADWEESFDYDDFGEADD
ncbi:MAG: hypothetical protein SPL21_06535 [Fibrobacter sp.]|uniref:hypothetical protein n=1 Tax=uncultured Fibrobacter sp. TaxID=261512 RepID=UPI0025EB9D76|nr:hypothetical protein [uncultured Fibrobacter sp.]MDY6387116.1 hypothetical protein [Fibrobacter sp.]